MFIVTKIFNYIIFPPSIFIIVLFISLYFTNKSRRKTIAFIAADIFLIYSLSIEPVKNLILSPLEKYSAPINIKEKYDADYIVILGGGTIDPSPEEYGSGSLSPEPMKRAVYGAYLAGIFEIPVIYSGGKLFDSQAEGEADIALKIMKRFTSEKTVLLAENRSRTTYENAQFIKNTYNPKKVILVTSAYHMKRSLYSFNAAGIPCIPAPTDFKIDNSEYNITSFLPKTYEMDNIYKALKEYVGLLFYSFK